VIARRVTSLRRATYGARHVLRTEPLSPTHASPFTAPFRSRLSVVSDNKLIEGIATIGVKDEEETVAAAAAHVIKSYAGVSKKGYAPYNPRKRNQDAILMDEHKATGTIVFGVFDGHGEAGDLVSHYFTDKLPPRLYANPKFASDVGAALAEELDKIERSLLAGACLRRSGVQASALSHPPSL
jgi:hypothetical protein